MANLKTIILFLSLMTLNCLCFASAKETAIPEDLQKEFAGERVSIDSTTEFSCVQDWLQMLVNRRGHGTVPHSLFISKVDTDAQQGRFVRVYWPNDNSIVTFSINELGCNAASKFNDVDTQLELEWLETKARIDLKKHIVAAMEDVGSSTYLVGKPWVDAVIDDCKKNGKMISLTPHKHRVK